jgi:type I restriction enzyme M protein
MNMILHNVTRFTIENGDTLEDPQIFENGRIRKFDRVLANPPFSQNYSRATLKFPDRFREWCPETGKKADLMFVQHMLASLKNNGHMATVMPHGVLFRGGKEKLIREILINDDVIEAIISLPPGLFYGTGIPACVIVANKSKPESLKNKILFINADREYGEGKAQNKLRPEDIEKIAFTFTNKREIPKYSRLVDRSEIVGAHDYNLNIRRYVDNTPDPETEDVQAHLIGGIPESEVEAQRANLGRFDVDITHFFQPERSGYFVFSSERANKRAIKVSLEAAKPLQRTLAEHHEALESWWKIARDDFSQLRNGKKMPEVRHELLSTLKAKLIPLKVLDEFKSAGVFVNWWQQIRYDLKTIVSTGWHHSLIPDDYLISAFFKADAEMINALDAQIEEAQSELTEAVETAQEVTSYEPDEEEKVTASVMKKALKTLIDDLTGSSGQSAQHELSTLKQQDNLIKRIEKRIKDTKVEQVLLSEKLEHKLQLKRVGGDSFKVESQQQIQQIDAKIAELDKSIKEEEKKIAALNKDKEVLADRIANTDKLIESVGGQLTETEAHQLILQKLYDVAKSELNRYLNTEKRVLIQSIERLWDKYAVPFCDLETARNESLKEIDELLSGLGYLQ